MEVQIDPQSIAGLKKIFADFGSNIKKELNTAINETAKKIKIKAARRLREVIPVKVSILKKAIPIRRKSNVNSLSSEIGMIKGYPIPLRYFGAKQTDAGVTYKQSGPDKGQGLRPNAFIVYRFGGDVYERMTKKRGPLKQQKGPKPSDYYASTGVKDLAFNTARDELPKQIKERIRFLTQQAKGQLKGKQK